MTLICNLYGGPGSGKSTTRAGVFNKMKLAGINCEETYEFAKDLTWSRRFQDLSCQPYVFGKQLRNLERLMGQVDVIVTDSPLLLSAYYGRKLFSDRYPERFYQSIEDIALNFNRLDIFINRVKKYNPSGRNQTEEEANEVCKELFQMLQRPEICLVEIDGNENAPAFITNLIEARLT